VRYSNVGHNAVKIRSHRLVEEEITLLAHIVRERGDVTLLPRARASHAPSDVRERGNQELMARLGSASLPRGATCPVMPKMVVEQKVWLCCAQAPFRLVREETVLREAQDKPRPHHKLQLRETIIDSRRRHHVEKGEGCVRERGVVTT
jgi:hypothetical protein